MSTLHHAIHRMEPFEKIAGALRFGNFQIKYNIPATLRIRVERNFSGFHVK